MGSSQPKPKMAIVVVACLLLHGISFIGVGMGRPLTDMLHVASDTSGLYHKAFPVVEPDTLHTKLAVAKQGLDVISRITNPVAVVAVIGPYRSGKSFLLNQLLSLSCNEGFGVGHMRDTKTRGIWVWGEPLEMEIDGVKTSVFFLDTEGFESIGKSTVYDDRIFALAAIMSSVLIYNLPETVREADIGKLSFAVQLAEEFYGRVRGRESTFQPARLLWLIQRDFLEGKSVQQMVDQALLPLPNMNGNKEIDEVNRIRESLAIMGENSTAFSLRQPHLARTKLCELSDADFDPQYVTQRDELKNVVASMISPKMVQGKFVNGKEFSSLLEQTLDALNDGDIPSAGSVVDAFNRAVVDRCLGFYETAMGKVQLPVPDQELKRFHDKVSQEALEVFDSDRFGHQHGEKAEETLATEIKKSYAALVINNQFTSSQLCEDLYSACEDQMDRLQDLRLPSMAKFEAGVKSCNQSHQATCLGPSKAVYEQRLLKMWERARSQFQNTYNHRLFNWLVVISLVLVAVGRFGIKFLPLEIAAWALFVFLEAYTHIFWSTDSLYYNPTWRLVVGIWEAIVYNSILDVDRWAVPLGWLSVAAVLLWRFYGRRKRPPTPLLPSSEARPSRFRRWRLL